jgi:anti-sigma regulatory factor (Ser/Thr protein kinase)
MGPWRPYDAVETIPFSPGSVLLLYTDGLVERRGEAIDRGFERLRAAASGAWDEQGATFADRVYAQLVRDTALEDDVALLAVESLRLGDRLELSLEASPHVLASLRRTVARWLTTMEVPDEARFDVVVALSEAAGNAVEHAYGAQDAAFSVTCERTADEVRVTVRDEGRWLPHSRESARRGRGLMMMRELMDEVDLRREESGTTVSMVKRVARPG